MIGSLRGTLVRKEPPVLLIEVGGVGYELEAPMTTFYELPPVGETVHLYTHLVVREDAHLLYGFARESQRRQFRALLKINGIGPRVALAVLSGLTEAELARCVADGDVARLTQVPGIGRKTAERLIVELRDRLADEPASVAAPAGGAPAPRDPVAEAVSALIALGYKPQEASRAVRAVPGSQDLSTEEIIRQALRSMAV
ncbi:MAG TPA: Holliday junction branch migration protein RuvA [Burkholderiales bacterium]